MAGELPTLTVRVDDTDETPLQWIAGRPYLTLGIIHRGQLQRLLWPLEVDPSFPGPEPAPELTRA